ncbi:hypothetical protein GCM10009848_08010 [Micromonospora lupini]|uniref:Putative transcriptional regulator, SARP family n=1 Tax=Micromonospora lupini str. Lupac 08 TaxID=1150864 RepID=I0KW19_9ACTN|nr:Putative transcriptional regulator, SARP family [Micromonospora lupini str. Lupac 08]
MLKQWPYGGDMKINALGPLTVVDDTGRLLSTVPKPRRVLALLVTHADQVVPTSMLLRELWGTDLPRTAMTTLQTYIGQLRRTLATAADTDVATVTAQMLRTETGGYELSSAGIDIDLLHFFQLQEAGKAALRAGNDREGILLLREALALWQGPPLVNVEPGPLLEAQVLRLEESRLCTLEQRLVAELRLGEHQALISELVELTTIRPLHESLHAHLMVALYRCGRRSEALAVFHKLRHTLITDLGLEPSGELLRLQHAILTADPALNLTERTIELLQPRAA